MFCFEKDRVGYICNERYIYIREEHVYIEYTTKWRKYRYTFENGSKIKFMHVAIRSIIVFSYHSFAK